MRVDLLVQRIALHREPIELTPAEVEANYADHYQANAACEIKADEPLRNQSESFRLLSITPERVLRTASLPCKLSRDGQPVAIQNDPDFSLTSLT